MSINKETLAEAWKSIQKGGKIRAVIQAREANLLEYMGRNYLDYNFDYLPKGFFYLSVAASSFLSMPTLETAARVMVGTTLTATVVTAIPSLSLGNYLKKKSASVGAKRELEIRNRHREELNLEPLTKLPFERGNLYERMSRRHYARRRLTKRQQEVSR